MKMHVFLPIYMEGYEFKPTYIYEEKDETAESYKAYHKP